MDGCPARQLTPFSLQVDLLITKPFYYGNDTMLPWQHALLEYERHKRLSDKLELPVGTLPEASVIDNENSAEKKKKRTAIEKESYYQTHPSTRGVLATGKAENLSDIHAIHFLISYGAAQNEEKLSQMVTTQLYATLSPSKASVPHDDRITSIKDIQGLLLVCVDNHDNVRMSINTDQLFYLKAAPKNLESSIYTYEIILMMEDNVDHIEPMYTHKPMEQIQHDGINKIGTSIHQNPMEKEILGESSNNNSNVQVKRELADASKNQSTKKRANQPNISQIKDKVSQMNKEDIAVTQNDNLSTDTANERYESDETPHDTDYASF
ncbi:Uncharacterized protein Fot_30512 [Forsythia ovata]|uniref:Uncharacterized protein n=1 Tax=Forsythia ovata TaxID=205694 RepID=A0ABD1TUY6_9LAMI